ncbi:GIY-YIG nuclease family protein [Shewanella nanhaiensis]|uniref:GIY-YIG nuclease family protein n=1 Tax=Shewanella nanhaiensis TaxID=2864872 RepID=A0ABS7E9I0_9GAMM|nr:GIY-YIG nuclease family protein [Shewanella nanhaiensis]MBW8186347.1 GIY-YIG nuclease family protein [Shewanella nanhaiensis]
MKVSEAIRVLLRDEPDGLTPQEIRERIKTEFPQLYGTEAHQNNVDKGHYQNLEHALLAQIYTTSRSLSDVYVDKSVKPVKLSLLSIGEELDVPLHVETVSPESISKLESGEGVLYVLGTNLFTKDGNEIIKIGITTGSIEDRINQLYTTGVPYKFRLIQQHETKNYAELEQSLHKILDSYRINKSREFFLDLAIEYVDKVIAIHDDILNKAI